jgi:hypothetical protein
MEDHLLLRPSEYCPRVNFHSAATDLHHDFVAAILAQQSLSQALQWRWHVRKRRPISQRPRLTLDQRNDSGE